MEDIFNFIRSEELEEVKALLNSNPEVVNSKDSRGSTPLLLASYYGFEDITKEILKYSPDIDIKDGSGNTALMGVCFKGYYTIAKLLIVSGADVNQKYFNEATALIYAATFGQKEIIKLLVENGADISAIDNRGFTAEMHAKNQGLEISELFKLTQ
jgi:ankyrin repeat protein